MRAAFALLGVLVLSAVTSCSGIAPDIGAAERAALDFHAALAAQDGAAACDLLAPATRDEVEKQSGTDCAATVTGFARDVGEVLDAKAFGRAAQVTLSGDTVFLALEPSGWLVTAAGCTPVTDRPYDCDVKGG